MPQFEVGQPELVAVHHWAYAQDVFALLCRSAAPRELAARVHAANACLAEKVLFSTSRQADYEKILRPAELTRRRQFYDAFLDGFMSFDFHSEPAPARAPRGARRAPPSGSWPWASPTRRRRRT